MIKVLELFGGYGSQALALENLGIEFESDLCEIDKYAIQAYNQLHGETFNYGDICTIDETKLPHYDLITYSSPCQDFSQAGKQAGGEKGSGTRSSLLWECERIIRAVKPKYLLMENVKALTSKKFMPLFAQWLSTLEGVGYKNWWKVLNAKDYGVPQNRERVFVVSILGDGQYQFPEPIPLTKRLKDVLEQNVDEKYYINKTIDLPQKDISNTIRVGGRGSQDIKHVWDIIQEPMNLYPNSGNPQAGRVYNSDGISPAMDTCSGGNRMPKITEYRFFEQAIKTAEEKNAKDGDTIDAFNKRVNDTGVCPTLTTRPEGFKTAILPIQDYRIRKLTPRECWRLMGVRDEQFDRIHGISNSQLYKMAGNSIVVDVLMAVFKNMLLPNDDELKELATKNDMLAMENEDLKDHCNALIGLVRSLDEEQIKENKGESKMKLGETVKIEQLGAVGRIIAIVISEYGKRYEVRYFWEGRPEQTMFFEDELTEVEK